jgi:hypothetical protein
MLVQSKRPLFTGGKDNIFDGIEHIDFNSPVASQMQTGTQGRSRKFRGFENKFFRPTRNRSPSPMTEEGKIFEDDDDEGVHQYDI